MVIHVTDGNAITYCGVSSKELTVSTVSVNALADYLKTNDPNDLCRRCIRCAPVRRRLAEYRGTRSTSVLDEPARVTNARFASLDESSRELERLYDVERRYQATPEYLLQLTDHRDHAVFSYGINIACAWNGVIDAMMVLLAQDQLTDDMTVEAERLRARLRRQFTVRLDSFEDRLVLACG